MELGCHLPNQGPLATREALTTFARAADEGGVASLWVSDHVIFPRTATGNYRRGRQADEALRVFKALWTQDNPAFEGEFFRFRDVGFAPKPVQKPHPPIWVGGDSPGAFRRVATLGDGWHATSKTPAQLAEALG